MHFLLSPCAGTMLHFCAWPNSCPHKLFEQLAFNYRLQVRRCSECVRVTHGIPLSLVFPLLGLTLSLQTNPKDNSAKVELLGAEIERYLYALGEIVQV